GTRGSSGSSPDPAAACQRETIEGRTISGVGVVPSVTKTSQARRIRGASRLSSGGDGKAVGTSGLASRMRPASSESRSTALVGPQGDVQRGARVRTVSQVASPGADFCLEIMGEPRFRFGESRFLPTVTTEELHGSDTARQASRELDRL